MAGIPLTGNFTASAPVLGTSLQGGSTSAATTGSPQNAGTNTVQGSSPQLQVGAINPQNLVDPTPNATLGASTTVDPAAQAAATGEKFYLSIDPAVFANYEVGGWASLFSNKVYVDYSFYRLEGNNELLGIRQPDNTTDYLSAGKTLHEGIEYQITYRPNDAWNFRFGGTNAKHTFVDFVLSTKSTDALKNVNGKEMPQAPNFIANSEVTYKYKGARIALEWQKIGPWFQDQVNKVSYEGVSVFNVRLGYNYKAYQFFTNIMNLGDALYATTATRGNNATDKSTYTPAAPRTVVAGIQIDVFQLFKK
jgi:outer membrane receptor for ferric coprogen and ferric-rhodotorulic acid